MHKTLVLLTLSIAVAIASSPLLVFGQSNELTIDETRVAAAGIHKLQGKRLTLYTDLAGPEIDILPTVFEQAFPQWCAYFGVKESEHANWCATGFLMKDKAKFVDAGLLPDVLPDFANGYSVGSTLWLYEQPSEYYRRHLLLHEGTHGFMFSILGSCGPPWYMEGMAEFMGTHRWHDGRLTLGYMPKNREEVPEWGRIRLIQDAVAKHKTLQLKEVVESPSTGHDDNESYAWRWATVYFLDRHPHYQERFHQLREYVNRPDFNERFYELFEPDWQSLCEEWQLMAANLEYGYDVARSAIDFTPGKPFPQPLAGEGQKAKSVTIAADRGWQNTGLRLEAGTKYHITASGRYQIAKESKNSSHIHNQGLPRPTNSNISTDVDASSKIWWCEPGGVTIRYYQGLPLGILLAAVRPDQPEPESTSALLHPTVIGLDATLTPKESGTLFLKVNDSAGELDDNAGELKVEIH